MATKLNLLPTAPGLRKAVVKDVKAAGTDAGGFTSGSYITRDLNTVEGDVDIVSVSSNQFTIQPGEYLVFGHATAAEVEKHKCNLYNITDAAVETEGTGAISEVQIGAFRYDCPSHFATRLVLTTAKTYEVRHRCEVTQATYGLGQAANYGEDEVYTTVTIIQLKEPE
jgi:hypothetical protein